MTAQEKLSLMILAMIGDDDWVALVEDEIAREEEIKWREWLWAQYAADDYEDYLADVEWLRGGC